ncbi:DNA ligase 6-like isoform X2 [Zingiber officinale]|uniref:DNA ligase 6-like isoform X2 n=1 Tax=Zingiber officinale TaxID=94328 RepID=UPI001C4DB4EB|nr:DNA ligase 6-like isoform X2 [Zingiber officinale]
MTGPPSPSCSSSLFLSSYRSFSASLPPSPSLSPLAFRLLSAGSPLPPVPSDFPYSKLIPRTRFVIDGFRSAGDFSVSYFLSHFHSDHYAGLSSAWCKGVIFCSAITARLLVEVLKVPPFFVVSLSSGEVLEIDEWEVAAVDANHCPGAVQFLFRSRGSEGRRAERYIHTGDFRFHESMKLDPVLCEFVGADAVFLDTTYCNPKFVFPSQEESVEYIVSTIKRIKEQNKETGESVLFLIATYVIGKEKILLEISRQCGCLLQVDSRKMQILSVLGLVDSGAFTQDTAVSNIHVIGWNVLGETWPYFRPNFGKMEEIMLERGYSKVVGFVSTGWMYETKKDGFAVRVKGSLEVHLVPYSEHSNYDELREYVKFLKPKRVIPTVGVDIETPDSKHALAMKKHFRGLVDEMANKHDFLLALHRKSDSTDLISGNDITVDLNLHGDVDSENIPLQPDLQNFSRLNVEDMEGTLKDLQDCLPSWVTQIQSLELLKKFNGDIIAAVTEFFEHETEFYKQANATNNSIVSPCEKIETNLDLLFPLKSPGEIPESGMKNFLSPVKQSVEQILKNTANPPLKKKRSSDGGKNKKKKKMKGCPTLYKSGGKQSIITNFFKKASADASSSFTNVNTSSQQISSSIDEDPVAVKICKEDLDKFLQVINDGIPRESAATLMEKAKGNIDVAVDMYYCAFHNVLEDDENLITNNVLKTEGNLLPAADAPIIHLDKNREKLYNSSSDRISLPTLYLKGNFREDKTATNVSLPIDKYCPIEYACWKAGEPSPYLHLARTFHLVEQEKGKIKTTTMLCNMFRSLLTLSPADVLPALYLCTNRIASDHENMELNVGGSLVVTALEEACGTTRSKIKEMYNKFGDLGDVAQEIRQTQALLAPPSPILIHHLFCILREISVITGSGSALRRKNLIVNLMRSCREMEMKFLVRTLVRNLRIGAMMKTILSALAQAVVLNSLPPLASVGISDTTKLQLQSVSAAVVEAFNVLPNLDVFIPSLLSKGLEFSARSIEMIPGTPILPLLARITNGVIQVMKLFEGRAFTCEYKYDGQRAQIHRLADGSIRIFSRQMKETTSRFPDLVNIIKDSCKPEASTFILDAEVVAVDRTHGRKLLSFQELSSRERGNKDSSISTEKIRVNICVFIFDIMLCNGERLLDLPLRKRRKYIKDLFNMEKAGYLEFAKEITVEADQAFANNQLALDRVNLFFEEARNSSCEGIMVKTLDDFGYSASKRCEAWLKVKRDYVEGIGDSLDLVLIGAWHGNGRKAGWYSPFLVACYNPDTEEFQSVCRVMSGFSDSFYLEMKEFLSGEKLLPRKPSYYQTHETPDLWFRPELVWEIRGADLTISPVHHAAVGLVHPSRGISVRLPRYIRSRPDKTPEDCSTSSDIALMYKSQTRKMEVFTED